MHTKDWSGYFATIGYQNPRYLAAGMEGVVYELDEDRVGKVWTRRTVVELVRLQHFYDGLAAVSLSFGTPRIFEVRSAEKVAITIESRLHGQQLSTLLSGDDAQLDGRAVACIVEVLRGLASIPATLAMRELAVVGGRVKRCVNEARRPAVWSPS